MCVRVFVCVYGINTQGNFQFHINPRLFDANTAYNYTIDTFNDSKKQHKEQHNATVLVFFTKWLGLPVSKKG